MKKKIFFLFAVVSLFAACGCAKNTAVQKIETRQLAKSCYSWDGAALPAYPQGKPEITILKIIIPPGASLVKHKHPVINAGVLLKGELTVFADNGKTFHVKSGEGLVEVVNTWHYGKNEGKEPAEIIVFYAGAEGGLITVHKQD